MKRLCYLLIAAALFVPMVAEAYVPSPQNAAFELKFGPYTPDLGAAYDSSLGGDPMFLTVLELDWQFWHPPWVSLAIGGTVGFMQAYDNSKVKEDGQRGTEDSADYSVLNVIPFSALFIARVDGIADNLDVPLVPYFKVGVNWYLWWGLEGGEVPEVDGEPFAGGTPGWQINTGIMLRLDPFDRMSARTFDNEIGVNHSYVFFEFMWAWVDGFGDDDNMNLSTNTFWGTTFLAGLCLEF